MSAAEYAEDAAFALEAIQEDGAAAFYQAPDLAAADPAKPWLDADGEDPGYDQPGAATSIVTEPYSIGDIDGDGILKGDEKGYIPAISPEPIAKGRINIGGSLVDGAIVGGAYWRIEAVKRYAPGGIPILFELHLRPA